MDYGFLFGAAGTGKTNYIYKYLAGEAEKHPNRRYYLFVPEQNTLKAQQELIAESSRHGMLNLDVLSFHLLAYRVMDELAVYKPDILDEMSKSMLLRASCKKTAQGLKVYQKKLDQAGFIAQLKSAISEFYQYDMTPELLKELSEKTENKLLSAKLSDLSLIFSAFREALSEKQTVAEEIPLILLKYIHRSGLLSDAEIVFDGYTGFTPVQLKIISHIMTKARSVRFAVTIPREAEPYRRDLSDTAVADLFWLSRETVAKLCALSEKNGLTRAEDLWFTEQHTHPAITVSAVRDPKEEAKLLVQRIKALTVGSGAALRYKDIAVAVSELSGYKELLRTAFSEAGVPYFMDDKADGRTSVLAELLRSALLVIQENYSYDAVLRYLRNPLVLSERETTDFLDNYVRARGLRGRKAFESEWSRAARGMETLNLAGLNAYKEAALRPVFSLQDRMREGGRTAAARIAALSGYLSDCRAKERLSAFCERLTSAGFFREASENARFPELIDTLFERFSSLLGEEKLSLKDFSSVLEAGFTELKAGLLPSVMDRVVIGDLKRSRFDDISVLFILGVNDGLLPSAVSGGGVLTDPEREELLSEGRAELAPADRADSCIQRFYLYLVMSKPRERLYLSYCKNDMQGGGMKPSAVLSDLRAEYADRGETLKTEEISAEGIRSISDALSYLADAFSKGAYEEKKTLAVYSFLCREAGMAEEADRLLSASLFRHTGDRLSEEAAKRLYGEVLYGSVTRLEQYARCPFAHFLKYGLRLSERQEFDATAADIGNLYHDAIKLAFQKITEEKKEISALSDGELSALSAHCVEQAAADYNNQIMQSSARNRYLCERVKRITGRTMQVLRDQFARGDFKLYGCELPFRFDADGMSLHGRIDRLDVCEDSSKVYVKVIDYKSGNTEFDLSMIWQGMHLQLVTYMNVALLKTGAAYLNTGKEAVPAGLFYYHIKDPVMKYEPKKEKEPLGERVLKALRLDGLASEDAEALSHLDRTLSETGTEESLVVPVKLKKDGSLKAHGSHTAPEEMLRQLSRFASDKMNDMKNEILGGEIDIHPYRKAQATGCDYCPYHSICGFDTKLAGFSYKNLKNMSKETVCAALSEKYGKKNRE